MVQRILSSLYIYPHPVSTLSVSVGSNFAAAGCLFGFSITTLVFIYRTRLTSNPIAFKEEEDSDVIGSEVEVEAETFYANFRRRKWSLIIITLILAWVSIFGTSVAIVQGNTSLIVEGALMSLFWVITSAIASISLSLPANRNYVNRSWDYTVTLTTLTLSALTITVWRFVVPSSLPVDSARSLITLMSSLGRLLLQSLAFVVAGTTRRSPKLGLIVLASSIVPVGVVEEDEDSIPSESSPLLKANATLSIPQDPTATVAYPVSDIVSCSPISYILFSWIDHVLARGAQVISLSASDLPTLGKNDRPSTLWKQIKGIKVGGGPTWCNALLWRIVTINWRLFLWQSTLALVNAFLYYLPAFFLQKLVAFLEVSSNRDREASLAWGYAYCLGLLVSLALDALVSGQLWFVSNSMLATRIRIQLSSLVFNKTLTRKDVSGSAAHKPTTPASASASKGDDGKDDEKSKGEDSFSSKSGVLNLFTIDVDRVSDFSIWCFSIIDAPAEIIIGTIFLHQLLGYAAFVGISVAVLFLPINHWASKQFATVQDKLMGARDRRVSLMNEVLQSIRMIKFFAFEAPFEDRILEVRKEELAHLRWNFYLEVAFQFIWTASPILCVLVSFYVYTVTMGQELTPSVAFASLAVWNELRFALNIIPDLIVNAIQCLVSLRRIESYLALPEVDTSDPDEDESALAHSDMIALNCATITWPFLVSKEDNAHSGTLNGSATPGGGQRFELQDLSVEFPVGQLTIVCGTIGSGKTLLLLSLLGEGELLAGQIICPRSSPSANALPSLDWEDELNSGNWIQPTQSAFVPQSPWLQSVSIRNNILFGLPYREKRYRAVIDACSLVSDLQNFEDGDSTEIGEKGVSLSGGMKARVSLARAVYSRAAILLLDDVLSAVDAHTSLKIYTDCLQGPLLRGRTVILVSHHVALVAAGAHYLVALENGRIKYQGLPSVYLATESKNDGEEPDEEIKLPAVAFARNKALLAVAESAPGSTDVSSASEAESDSDSEDDDNAVPTISKPAKKMIEDEKREVGRVDRSVWMLYLGANGGAFYFAVFASIFVGSKLLAVGESLWLAIWSRSYDTESIDQSHTVYFYLSIYAVLSFMSAIVYTAQWLILYSGSLAASEKLHKTLLHAVLRAPLRFFETTSIGRTLNRFGKDLESIDSTLPDNFGRSLEYSLGVVSTLAVITSVQPFFLLGFLCLSVIYFKNALVYSKSARELRRLDSVSKSPLYSIYEEAISGIAVIRAFGASDRFMKLFLERVNTNITFYWYLWSVNRWLSIRFALLSAIVVGLTGYVLVSSNVDAALAGFALSFSLNISTEILFLVRRYTALELTLVAVERLKEYSELKQEAAEIVFPRPEAIWPSKGRIQVKDLSIRYDPSLPNVLHDINLSVAAGEKIGIVGSTGSGKSTIALSFFRFVEPWTGSITIDGIDISTIGLTDLRRRLTIIPQDPTILSGTLRSALDIFSEYTDSEIFDALRRVHLIKPEDEDPSLTNDDGANLSPFLDLSGEVSEGGTNFSQGQRQLLCMARALLRKNRIILMDEATASVDSKTDEAISITIRSELAGSTLLVIAHRLRTIIDFDKVLLLDRGRVIEFDSPANLLKNTQSRFYALARATGPREFKTLRRMADGRKKVVPQSASENGVAIEATRPKMGRSRSSKVGKKE